jgi:spore germination protein GerM
MTRPPARPRPDRWGRLVVVVLLGVSAACGIPADDGPRSISDDKTPGTMGDGPEVAADGQTLQAELYFTRFDGRHHNLVPIKRRVPTGGSSSTPTPATVLEALLSGVGEDASALDVVTKIPADTGLASQPELKDGILTVDLTEAINGVQSDGARLAYGQMVCTVAALDEVESVLFTVEGQPVPPPTGDGDTTNVPLTCASYASLLEAPAD